MIITWSFDHNVSKNYFRNQTQNHIIGNAFTYMMNLEEIEKQIPKKIYRILRQDGIEQLTPAQAKAVKAGLLEYKSLLICTPTASGKTMAAELAFTKSIIEGKGKAIYIVPLKALGSEKFKDFKKRYEKLFRIALSIGDLDSADPYLIDYELIITTSEKLDSLIRHHAPWLKYINTIVVDEIHLLNDPGRGPTLEVILTIFKKILPKAQIIGLSATIGNPKELADWLGAQVVVDDWRPVELRQGVYLNGEIRFED